MPRQIITLRFAPWVPPFARLMGRLGGGGGGRRGSSASRRSSMDEGGGAPTPSHAAAPAPFASPTSSLAAIRSSERMKAGMSLPWCASIAPTEPSR